MKTQTTTQRREKFEKLALLAEQDYKTDPAAYKRKLKWLAYLGYGYLFFILFLCVAFIVVVVYLAINSSWFWLLLIKKKLIIVVALIFYTIFKAVTVKIPSPTGYRLNKEQAPELYNSLEAFRKKLKAVKIHEVLITPEFNAAIVQTPRLGVFGWHKNSLILGAELLVGLNQQQVLSVIAHEMGHLSGGHAKFNAWIYRVRMTWMHIVNTMGHLSGIVTWIFGKFFNWYAPYFNAYSFALARSNEYEADEVAVQLTSRKDFATALTKVFVLSDLGSQEYWSQLQYKAYQIETTENSAVSTLVQQMQVWQFSAKDVENSIAQNMQTPTNYLDTHPIVRVRAFDFGDYCLRSNDSVFFSAFLCSFFAVLALRFSLDFGIGIMRLNGSI
jgi:Zn-dependent protease with chaperone function